MVFLNLAISDFLDSSKPANIYLLVFSSLSSFSLLERISAYFDYT